MDNVKKFVAQWSGRGYEKGEMQPFWLSFLRDVLRVSEPEKFIRFEVPVKLKHTSFIDAFLPDTKVIIEQKSLSENLTQEKSQSDGSTLTPYEQAQRYGSSLPYSMRPRWIVVCNFAEFLIYDMETLTKPTKILLSELPEKFHAFDFLVDHTKTKLRIELELSLKAGEIVGKLYDTLHKQYRNPNSATSFISLNKLCVRLVFCLYAESAGIFGKHKIFRDYLEGARNIRRDLLDLFETLNTPLDMRDPYLDDTLKNFPYVNGGLALFDDIVDNDAGYFVGALLCVQIRPATPNIYGEYEVIDGQQRLTTMSLLLAAIYKVIDNYGADNLSKKQKNLFEQIEVQLAVEDGNGDTLLRVFPQKDQQNRDDYIYIMGSGKDDFLNFISIDMTPPANMGNRRICKAYRFFKSAVSKYARDSSPKDQAKQLNTVFDVLAKVNAATFVRILSPTRASANKLFEALNNRGIPLTITDLIKNQLLSKFTNDTEANKKWREAVEIFSRDGSEIPAGEQERFFRQTHNAYRYSWDKPIKLTVAKRANLYEEYEKMTESPGGAEKLLKQLLESSRLYNQIQGYAPDEVTKELQSLYEDLRRINGATSYVLLLYLLKNRDELNIGDDDLKKILRLLIAFFVRHSFTNNPPSNALERIFNRFIEEVAVGLKDKDGNSIAGPYTGGKTIFEKLNERLKKEYLSYSGGNDNFESVLRGNVYDGTGSDDNIRFVLVKLAEKHLSGKTQVKFWEKKYPDTSDKPKKKRARLQIPTDDSSDIPDNAQKGRDRPIWSIEHILPQTLTQEWIDELGCQNEADAKVIQEEHVHKLGNLTLTKYNSEMKNLSFVKKRDLTDKKNIFIGYKDSPLKEGLNSYIVAQDVWTPEQINKRTELLIKEILEIFAW